MRPARTTLARAYVLYGSAAPAARRRRDERQARRRAERVDGDAASSWIAPRCGSIQASCDGLDAAVSADAVLGETLKNLYDGVPLRKCTSSAILAARALVETDPDYGRLSARLLLHSIRAKCWERSDHGIDEPALSGLFPRCIQLGIDAGRLDQRLARFDLDRLARGCSRSGTCSSPTWGLQYAVRPYFLHHDGRRFELPQTSSCAWRWGWSLNEMDPKRARIESTSAVELDSCARPRPFSTRTPPATPVVLPDHGRGRPGLDLQAIKENAMLASTQGALATIGPRCERSARIYAAPTANHKASCHS